MPCFCWARTFHNFGVSNLVCFWDANRISLRLVFCHFWNKLEEGRGLCSVVFYNVNIHQKEFRNNEKSWLKLFQLVEIENWPIQKKCWNQVNNCNLNFQHKALQQSRYSHVLIKDVSNSKPGISCGTVFLETLALDYLNFLLFFLLEKKEMRLTWSKLYKAKAKALIILAAL